MRAHRRQRGEPIRPVWDPAGPDQRLAAAAHELRVGRYVSAAELLGDSRDDPDRRCHRFLVLAQIATDSDVAERWLDERPDSADALLLLIRVAVIRAAHAVRGQHPKAGTLTEHARHACLAAAKTLPRDPLPWVALLQLAAFAPEPVPGPADLAVDGPWHIMEQLWHREPDNREGHHRLLAAVGPNAGGSVDSVSSVAFWIAGRATDGSALHVLPLVALAERFKRFNDGSPTGRLLLADRNWGPAFAHSVIEACHPRWYASPARKGDRLLPDLHHLAHALWAAGDYDRAADVFATIGPFALTTPWSLHGDPAQVFREARERCVSGL